MNNDALPIGAIIGIGIATFLLSPWLLLAGGAFCAWKWFKHWRYENLQAAQQYFFVEFDYGPHTRWLMYLGADDTIRWWYCDGYLYPQAIDNGKMYWDKCIEVKDQTLLKHLRGFYEMGNEWPTYYKSTQRQVQKVINAQRNKSKNKRKSLTKQAEEWAIAGHPCAIKYPTSIPLQDCAGSIAAVASKLPRADYADGDRVPKYAGTAAMMNDSPLLDMIKTVEDLEKDVTGRCPTINFEGITS